MTSALQSGNEASVRTLCRTSSQGTWARHRLVALIAISFISGCTSKQNDSDSRLSDAELLKLNLQCREAADRHAEDKKLASGDFARAMFVTSSKYSQKHRRCLAEVSDSEMKGFKIISRTESLIDPVSSDIFASSFNSFSGNEKTYGVDQTMTGGREGNSFSSVSDKEFREFVNRAMLEP
jgi:hypothetical protein